MHSFSAFYYSNWLPNTSQTIILYINILLSEQWAVWWKLYLTVTSFWTISAASQLLYIVCLFLQLKQLSFIAFWSHSPVPWQKVVMLLGFIHRNIRNWTMNLMWPSQDSVSSLIHSEQISSKLSLHFLLLLCMNHTKKLTTVNVLKFWTLSSFCSQIKCWFSGLEFTNFLSELQTGKTLIRLLLQKKSDLGLPCLSRPFCQATIVRNFRTFTVIMFYHLSEALLRNFSIE